MYFILSDHLMIVADFIEMDPSQVDIWKVTFTSLLMLR